MAIKKFTAEGKFECGLMDFIEGKVHAYMAVPVADGPFGLAIAVANEPGYYAVPVYWAHSDTREEMSAHADELNEKLGLNLKASGLIIASSMRPPKPSEKGQSDG